MKDIKILSNKERSVLAALGVYLYADRKLLNKILSVYVLITIRWKAGSKIVETQPDGWIERGWAGEYLNEYSRKGGVFYDNEKLEGEGFQWGEELWK